MCKFIKLFFYALCITLACKSPAFAEQTTSGGKLLSNAEINQWSITVYPDGRGLPEGNGTAAEGKATYQAKCLACHGDDGTNGVSTRLVGKEGYPEGSTDLFKTLSVGAWPNATSIFDFVRRAMPHHAPKSLGDDEVYQLTAYILHLNDLVKIDQVIDKGTLPYIEMPNKHQAINIWDSQKLGL